MACSDSGRVVTLKIVTHAQARNNPKFMVPPRKRCRRINSHEHYVRDSFIYLQNSTRALVVQLFCFWFKILLLKPNFLF